MVSDNGIGRDEDAHLATSQLGNSVQPQPLNLLQRSVAQLEALPHQIAAEVDEECCSRGEKFANDGKDEDIATTPLIAPAPSTKCEISLSNMMITAPGANEHRHQDGDDALQNDCHGVVLLHCRLMEVPGCSSSTINPPSSSLSTFKSCWNQKYGAELMVLRI